MTPLGILETCLYVDDLEAAENFYRNVLHLPFYDRQAGRHIFFRSGSSMLLIFNADESRKPTSDLPPHGAFGCGHVAFAVESENFGEWQSHLLNCGVAIEKVIHWPQGGQSIYFRDPAGNSVELATPNIWRLDDRPGAADTRHA